jgi:hypothetical protein
MTKRTRRRIDASRKAQTTLELVRQQVSAADLA